MEYMDINSISELHEFYKCGKPLHPLITVVDLSKVDRSDRKPNVYYRLAMYSASCKQINGGQLKYGRSVYDFSEGSLMFMAPYQVLAPDPDIKVVEGWGLYIHPDFLNTTDRGRRLTGYSFFGYDNSEALHISDAEKTQLEDCLHNIRREISQNLDRHSYDLILSNLDLFFAYCNRFYDRQFLTRSKVSADIVQRFDKLLGQYFSQESLIEAGLPDVKYFAGNLNLSPNYLSDLLRKYTGKSTQEHIHLKLAERAKTLLWSTEKNISEIAYELGFEHPSHFTKLFRSQTGKSPREFRTAGREN